jgi:hypothetical protein
MYLNKIIVGNNWKCTFCTRVFAPDMELTEYKPWFAEEIWSVWFLTKMVFSLKYTEQSVNIQNSLFCSCVHQLIEFDIAITCKTGSGIGGRQFKPKQLRLEHLYL